MNILGAGDGGEVMRVTLVVQYACPGSGRGWGAFGHVSPESPGVPGPGFGLPGGHVMTDGCGLITVRQ